MGQRGWLFFLALCFSGAAEAGTIRAHRWRVYCAAAMLAVWGLFAAGAVPAKTYTYLSQFGSLGSGNGQFGGLVGGPNGIAIDPTSHNIVVADQANHRVQIFSASGTYLSQFGTMGSANGQFIDPTSVAIDPTNHDIVVTDYGNYRVQIFDSSGGYLGQFGSFGAANGQFKGPQAAAIDPVSHNIAVSDIGTPLPYGNDRVQIFSAPSPYTAYSYASQFGGLGSGSGTFHGPQGVAFDPVSDNLLVADFGNNLIQTFSSSGAFLSQFGSAGTGNGQFAGPFLLAIDSTNRNIVVSDVNNNRVEIFSSTGTFVSQFGSLGSGNGSFSSPSGVAVDPTSDYIVVGDFNNSRVQIFAPVAPAPVATPTLAAWAQGLLVVLCLLAGLLVLKRRRPSAGAPSQP